MRKYTKRIHHFILFISIVCLILSAVWIIKLNIELSKQQDVPKENGRKGITEEFSIKTQSFGIIMGKIHKDVRQKLTVKNLRKTDGKKGPSTDMQQVPEVQGLPKKAIIKAAMTYVYNNSVHLIDQEYHEYADKPSIFMEKMYLASSGKADEKPHLSCGTRAYAMGYILATFKIYSRLVQVYSDHYNEVQGHRMLEVYNQDVNRWELWDPDYGVVYVKRTDGAPVGVIELVFGDKCNIIPVGLDDSGWKETKTEHLRNYYFKAVCLEEFHEQVTDIIVNSDIFDSNKKFASGLTFEEWARNRVGPFRMIYFNGSCLKQNERFIRQ